MKPNESILSSKIHSMKTRNEMHQMFGVICKCFSGYLLLQEWRHLTGKFKV